MLEVLKSNELTDKLCELYLKLCLIRDEFGSPIRINSGYRNRKHNTAVHGSLTSQHLKMSAVDITCDNLRRLLDVLIKCDVFGQVILHRTFIHVGLPCERFPVNTYFYSLNAKTYKIIDNDKLQQFYKK